MTGRGDERVPVGQLGPEPWLTAPGTQAVVAALESEGGAARFVGGAVRDSLIHRFQDAAEIDLATTEPPDRVMALLERHGLAVYPTGLAHGTISTRADDRLFEITTLRRDVACDGRHAEVAFTTSFREDASRRDFTINALSADPQGRVYDYFDGMSDLADGRVRFVGRPMDRIREDFLRILRFFRFHAWYGRPPADDDALSACGALASGLDGLARERVRAEIVRILAAPDPAGVLALMRGARVLERVVPGAEDLSPLRALVMLETRGLVLPGLGPDPVRRLASVLGAARGPDPGEGARAAASLSLSRADSTRLGRLMAPDPAPWPDPGWEAARVRQVLDVHGRETIRDRILLRWAAERANGTFPHAARTESWRALLEMVLAWDPPPFPVRGEDVLARGLSGPAVGRTLAVVRRYWLEMACIPDREALLSYLDTLGSPPFEGNGSSF
ncbi:CCA tRNA nucleotidyltransferase [Pararhodospirillum oryzae]|uniref:Polynucleotide adenylyltransferase n=1 Tax=Pararhodospirillum oryzae TaxID=478448 RepID=A0A512H8X3_9PROT|nr:CCA tRNA nucleotidyltransferase [Pararhodospirillum oryzae]GEO81917.1 polynucleotide adenylyltransferase [Pararhodospirillum oryzae]